MRRTTAFIISCGLLAMAPAGAWGQTPGTTSEHLEHLMVQSADTPAEHLALARYYRMKAADARSLAQEHLAMAKNPASGKLVLVEARKKHCERIASLNDELAGQYDEMAKQEEAAAGM